MAIAADKGDNIPDDICVTSMAIAIPDDIPIAIPDDIGDEIPADIGDGFTMALLMAVSFAVAVTEADGPVADGVGDERGRDGPDHADRIRGMTLTM